MNSPRTRRMLLGNTIAGLATGAVMGGAAITVATPETLPLARVPNPDADVLAACRDFDDLERRVIRAYESARTLRAEMRADQISGAAKHRQGPLLDRIVRHRCTTMGGMQAKARTLALVDPRVIRPSGYWDEDLRASLLGDLLGIEPFDEAQVPVARKALGANSPSAGSPRGLA